jgi:ATP-binding cassette subfamily B protein
VARLAQDQVGDLTTVVEESVLGIRIIKGFGRHRSQARAFRELSRTLRGTELRKARLLASIWGVIVTLPEIAIGAALVLGSVQVADGDLSAGTLVAFLSTALALRWPIDSIGFLLAISQDAASATERYFEVMDEVPEDATVGVADGDREDSGLRFDGVVFRYPDAPLDSPPVLDRIDLHIRPGESMALVGATGSGKTTLTALVPRLHETTSGRITLDGEDITAMSREELRSLVAVAFEEPTLFSASVGENVLMGAEEGDLDRALAVAQADFVHALPHGTGTQVGEQGLSLSGGQRQRLALARCSPRPPRSSWRTGPRPCCSPTGSPCCHRAGSPPWAPTTNCCARTPSTPTSWRGPGRRGRTDDGADEGRAHRRRRGTGRSQVRGRRRPLRP